MNRRPRRLDLSATAAACHSEQIAPIKRFVNATPSPSSLNSMFEFLLSRLTALRRLTFSSAAVASALRALVLRGNLRTGSRTNETRSQKRGKTGEKGNIHLVVAALFTAFYRARSLLRNLTMTIMMPDDHFASLYCYYFLSIRSQGREAYVFLICFALAACALVVLVELALKEGRCFFLWEFITVKERTQRNSETE